MEEIKSNIVSLETNIKSGVENTRHNSVKSYNDAFNAFMNIDWKNVIEFFTIVGKIIVVVFGLIGRNYNALNKLSQVQLIYFGMIPDGVCLDIINSNKPDEILYEYLKGSNFDNIQDTILKSKVILKDYACKKLYTQSISAYKRNQHTLACVGLTTILDSIISIISNSDITSFKYRLELVYADLTIGRVINAQDVDTIIASLALEQAMCKFVEYSDFDQSEPQNMNRHWIMHGRSIRNYNKLDCIKLIGMVYSLLVIGNMNQDSIAND